MTTQKTSFNELANQILGPELNQAFDELEEPVAQRPVIQVVIEQLQLIRQQRIVNVYISIVITFALTIGITLALNLWWTFDILQQIQSCPIIN